MLLSFLFKISKLRPFCWPLHIMLSLLVPYGSCNIHGAISPEARASHVPLYNALSILVSVKTSLSIFIKQVNVFLNFFIKVSNSCSCHVE
jgi:hypothetical protein